VQEHAQLEVDVYNFTAALRDGALEACLRYFERRGATARSDPLLNCKLAEALLHDGRPREALACVRRGFPEAGDDPALLRICAWVFSDILRRTTVLTVTSREIPSSMPLSQTGRRSS
jgi:hypothetical protein